MEKKLFGTLGVRGDQKDWQLQCDRVAVNDSNQLLFCSVLAPAQTIKGIRAILNSNSRCDLNLHGLELTKPSGSYLHCYNRWLAKFGSTYSCETHRVGLGQVHAFLYVRSGGFLLSMDEEHLWQELKKPHYNTPILREWMPWLAEALRENDLLNDAYCYRCKCGTITQSNKAIDEIVVGGVASGAIRIESRKEELVEAMA